MRERRRAGGKAARAAPRVAKAHGAPARRAPKRRQRWSSPVLFAVALVVAMALTGGLTVTSDLILGGASSHDSSGTPVGTRAPAATPTVSPTPRPPGPPIQPGVFETRSYKDPSGASMTYYLYGPNSYTPAGRYPLVVVLHGGGERADPSQTAAANRDVVLRQRYVTAFTQPDVQARWPCFVVVPQAPLSQRWVGVPASLPSYTLASSPTQAMSLAMAIVRYLQQAYPAIDSNRIYVGGISMGGFGTWEALERWPDTFAAGLPIAGSGDPQAAGVVQAAVWAFHGSGDAIVPVAGSRLMVQALEASGHTACYTEYPGDGHNIWVTERPYSDPTVLTWLFSQHRNADGTVTGLDCGGRAPREQ